MIEHRIRVYTRDGFSAMPAPEWLQEADRLCEAGRDWIEAVRQALEAEDNGLVMNPLGETGFDVRFWRSPSHGTYVEIGNELGPIEEVLVPHDTDWLPFLATYLTPLLSSMAQADVTHQLERIGDTLISWARHGQGEHVDRYTGRSEIDARRDAAWRAR